MVRREREVWGKGMTVVYVFVCVCERGRERERERVGERENRAIRFELSRLTCWLMLD